MDIANQASATSEVAVAITVLINRQPVTFHERKETGTEIKTTAINQGVTIQTDFNLFLVEGPNKLKPIGDTDVIELHPNQEFRAVAPDDNS